MGTQTLKDMRERGVHDQFDWVVKVDPEVVFLPDQLKKALSDAVVPATGLYLSSPESAQNGIFGNMAAFSVGAFNMLLANIDACEVTLDWKHPGAILEGDQFAQRCLDVNGVMTMATESKHVRPACKPKPKGKAKGKHGATKVTLKEYHQCYKAVTAPKRRLSDVVLV